MKKILIGLLALCSFSTFASSMNCQVTEGDFHNEELVVKSLRLEKASGQIDQLVINVFGHEEKFQLVARSTSGNSSKLDFDLASHPDEVKAVLLLDRATGRINKKVNGLLVITGTGINVTLQGAPMLSKKSLVYNIACKMD